MTQAKKQNRYGEKAHRIQLPPARTRWRTAHTHSDGALPLSSSLSLSPIKISHLAAPEVHSELGRTLTIVHHLQGVSRGCGRPYIPENAIAASNQGGLSQSLKNELGPHKGRRRKRVVERCMFSVSIVAMLSIWRVSFFSQ